MTATGGVRAIVIGRAGMDLAPEPAGAAIDEATTFSASLGGSAANISVGICRLDGEAALLTCLSHDPVGDYCIRQLESYGVATDLIARTGGETRSSLALSEARVENHRTLIYRNKASDLELSTEHLFAIDWAAWNTLVVTGTALAVDPSRSATFEALRLARAHKLRTVIDIDYRPYSWNSPEDAARTLMRASQLCDDIIANDEEFAVLANGRDGFAAARQLAETAGRRVIYKMGAAGSVTFHSGEASTNGIRPVTPLKPTGAGDAFMAAYLTATERGDQLDDAIAYGSTAAAIVVTRPGCAPAMPIHSEIVAFANTTPMTTPPEITETV
ncbi:MAG: PfkB family carbohydrate kinase [Pseudomonadota bacterium]